jgi:ABC-type uncharacterized transport system ATPase subunit
MTFQELVEIEPRLELLRNQIRYIRGSYTTENDLNTVWYLPEPRGKGLKAEMIKLVGFYAELQNPTLNSHLAYELAYKTLMDELFADWDKEQCRLNQ